MSERLRRIFLLPSLRSCSTRRGKTSSPTPTASLPWKSTMTTSPFLRVSMFIVRGDDIRMNLVLLFEDDFVAPRRARLAGRRLRHVASVHRAAAGHELVVGLP